MLIKYIKALMNCEVIVQKEKVNNINICLSCDENYSQHASVVIASILANSKNTDVIHFYILDGHISKDSKAKILLLKNIRNCEIDFIQVNENDFDDYKKIQTHYYISLAACYRLKIASLLPNVDKIIYLDCDVIVCSTLSNLFNIDLQGKIMAGVLDIDIKRKNRHPNYVNSGVLLMDLNQIRLQRIEDELLEYTSKNINSITMGDQEIINNVLQERILNIDEKFNVQSESFIRRSSFTKNPTIIHFIGPKKPWHWASWSVHKYLYFKYLQMTSWKLSKLELYKWTIINKFSSFITWFYHRPLFYLQSKFWNALKQDITTNDKPKIFVVVLLACFGDIILCNSLFQNIKNLYPNSKTIFIVDKPWFEAAKYQKDVDEVYLFDKKNTNKGLLGLLRFIRKFPYKNIDYIFNIYQTERSYILTKLLRHKKHIGQPYNYNVTVQERHNCLLKKITNKKIVNYPITYIANNDIPKHLSEFIIKGKKYIALCATSKLEEKDMPIDVAIDLINLINDNGYEVLFLGAGNKALNYAEQLKNNSCRFINLVNNYD
jgi:lipopolysaccharide biosynthesis glycosyltransferase